MESYDVLVIGAGPAGLAAAKKLAESKVNVLCVDKKQEIGAPKRCAEGLGLGWFKRLNLKPQKEWAVQEIYGAALYSPDGKKLNMRSGEISGYVLERKMFEKYLAREAALAGAKIFVRQMVTAIERKNGKVVAKIESFGVEREVSANLVIACDGVESKIARMLGLNTTNKLLDIDSGFQYEMANIDYAGPDLINLFFGTELAPRGYCLTGESEVYAKNTIKPITEIAVGEDVLTLNGWMPVSAISEREYAGELISVTPFMTNTKTEMTADHLVFVWNKKEGYYWKAVKNLSKGTRGKHGEGDYLVFPLPEDNETKFLKVGDYFEGILKDGMIWPKGKNQFGAEFKYKKGIPERLELTEELLEFMGWFVSEGNANSNGIIISNTDARIVKRLARLGKKELGLEPHFWEQKISNTKTCTQVAFSSVIIKKVFSKLFGVGCKNKKLPNFVYGLSGEKKIALLRGLFGGDGSKEISSEGYNILNYTSISKSLIHDIWMLTAKMGVVGAIGHIKKKNAWRIRFRGMQLDKLEDVLGRCKFGSTKRNRGFLVKDNRILLGIRELNNRFYSGKVYDIESGGSFCAHFAVHNCWIFPKGKNEANVGIGIAGNRLETAKSYLDKFVASQPGLKKGSIIEVNCGCVPVGGFLEKMAADNLLVAGDAAHHVNPAHGGGIGIAMEAGILAAEQAVLSIKEKDYSEKFLNTYTKKWYDVRGNKLKKILRARHMLEEMSDEDFNYLVSKINGDDIMKIADGDILGTAKFVTTKLATNPKLMKLMLRFLKN